ncbi:hypothetical protein M2132_002164 [Dysgonomonas sp. PH5-45]|uniref:GNAT family N-acetyltransferase n=1 Tax=unclassified Dysgonomonas TaxID=2630389 RepID=UPI00247405CE|nr:MULTISPECIES: GNAT family N-acetyltransferase [unclassified Dysgonomonas]MDH6355817.1 hypothetical protein [Dysgonomonas sp. PH5-45]MDH6388716.1 hypothetical protein [Dysgonomonas sp. PH5-37]
MEIKRFNAEHKSLWDSFIDDSRNGTFLLKRDYMEYHSDRFHDHSLLFFDGGKLLALLPANAVDDTFYSHQGLTYGSFVLGIKTTSAIVLDIFACLLSYLREKGFKQLIYKPIPHIYHKQPAEEDLYALFRNEAKLLYRNLACCINIAAPIKYSRIRKRAIVRANESGLNVVETSEAGAFWTILEENLGERYGTKPVHSLEEISCLIEKFSSRIRLFQSVDNKGCVLAGALVFDMEQVVHVQYTSANAEGKKIGALDIIYDHLLTNIFPDKRFFDFGTSNEEGGRYLNESLIAQKESFGGRGIAYDGYLIEL